MTITIEIVLDETKEGVGTSLTRTAGNTVPTNAELIMSTILLKIVEFLVTWSKDDATNTGEV